jgi:hypothetical protein
MIKKHNEMSEDDMRINLQQLENVLIERFGSVSEAARAIDFDQSDLAKFLNGKKDFRLRKFAFLLRKFGYSLSFDEVVNGFVKDRYNLNAKNKKS